MRRSDPPRTQPGTPAGTSGAPCPQGVEWPHVSVAEYLGLDETRLVRNSHYPADPRATEPATSVVAIALCATFASLHAMTPRQRDVFLTLVGLQLECGAHSLLPNVMEELLQLAWRPWWDPRLAAGECEPAA